MPQNPSSPAPSLLRQIASLAGPIFVANLAIVLTGTLDTVMVGHLSAEQLAGVALGATVINWILVSFAGVIQGLSPIAGYLFGAKDYPKIGQSLVQGLWLGLPLSVLAVFLGSRTAFWLELAGMTGPAAGVARDYIHAALASIPAVIFARSFVAVNSAVSMPVITMGVMLASVALKIPLNLHFIYGGLGLPAMGGAGAGLASSVSCSFSLAAYALVWLLHPRFARMRAGARAGLRPAVLARLLRLGVPIGLSSFFEMSSYTLMAIFIARLGVEALSAHQIVANLVWLYYVLPLAVGVAGSVLVAQSLGEGKPARAREAAWLGVCFSLGCALVIAALTWSFRAEIAAFYTSDTAIRGVTVAFLAWVPLYHVMDSLQCSCSNILRGYQVTFLPMAVSSLLLCGVGLALGCVFSGVFPGTGFNAGAVAFWQGADAALVLAAAAMLALLRHFSRAALEKPAGAFGLKKP
ncbi:MATE family efflux transporter [Mesosutterella sp. AGMB02718]|uniref:MATE family efflux transporter n=1 Tax=Mesosutterella faecium TaxID=2925194 RepID=A0ABT7IP30_9BURK|nr:MATE family efflux transporter [Mesosutterella sp. AGMB02718]MDL2060140.1 MATE family efflux transporter [Mesosutterella sp. AGMB02718]